MIRDADRFEGLRSRCEAGREAVLREIGRLAETRASGVSDLCSLLLDYPLRPAKALRPTLCLSVATALGASDAAALPSAAALELLHNAFLIHDDVEDGSHSRRGSPTLHQIHGAPTAINVADGMFALSLYPLLENCEHLGIGPALAVLETIADMVRITVEGQALELAWIRENRWSFQGTDFRDAYTDLVVRKTAHYSFVAPVAVACLVAGADPALRSELERYARHLGVAFQIADDILNLEADEGVYGKEQNGDLWEGKRTLILMHAVAQEGSSAARVRAMEILARPRPAAGGGAGKELGRTLDRLCAEGRISAELREEIIASARSDRPTKSAEDVQFLRALIDAHGSVAAARAIAVEQCQLAEESLRRTDRSFCEGTARRFLVDLVPYVIDRLQ